MNQFLKIITIAFTVFVIGCKTRLNHDDGFDLLGVWRSDLPRASEVGDVLLEFRFLPKGNYEIHTIPVGEEGAFIEWGRFEVVSSKSVSLDAKFMGGEIKGEITEKDRIDKATAKYLVRKELRYEIMGANKVRLWLANDPSARYDFSRVSQPLH